ncbi:hypothetical protein [Amycolatopsis sp.]|jgi:hypothetical protein|nr:hypothetical protein [Amycolatopsis sp.]
MREAVIVEAVGKPNGALPGVHPMSRRESGGQANATIPELR